MSADGTSIVVNDVGPRDGLQNQSKILAPADRVRLVRALLDAGLDHVEVGAFVSPAAVPAMAGADEVLCGLRGVPDATLTVLIPNTRGYELAVAAVGLAPRRDRGDAQRVVPVRVHALEVVDEVGLDEAVDVEIHVGELDAVLGLRRHQRRPRQDRAEHDRAPDPRRVGAQLADLAERRRQNLLFLLRIRAVRGLAKPVDRDPIGNHHGRVDTVERGAAHRAQRRDRTCFRDGPFQSLFLCLLCAYRVPQIAS